jgi:8-oxo-dGTP pyrophosphatase MutT (NUDIX family)
MRLTMRLDWSHVESALALRPPKPLAVACRQRAAVALVLSDPAGALDLLFVRRAEHPTDPWSGHMAFPGGRSEPGDRDLLATSVRETLEETGLDLDAIGSHLSALDEVKALGNAGPIDLSIAPFLFRLRAPGRIRLADELVSAHWMRLDTLVAPDSHGETEVELRGAVRRLPCLRVDGQVIWGLTYRMFEDLAERLRWVREQRLAALEKP